MLASPATGPVDHVWYSRTAVPCTRVPGGRVFETSDYEVWTPSEPRGTARVVPPVVRVPESGAAWWPAFGRVYALGRKLFRSDDGGRTWSDLTALQSESVIGLGQTSVAVSPANPDQIVVANQYGVWRSMDGGLSWAGPERIAAEPRGTAHTFHAHRDHRHPHRHRRLGADGTRAR